MAPELEALLRTLPCDVAERAAPLGLVLPPNLDRESWSALISSVAQMAGRVSRDRNTITAWLGDILAYGHNKYRGQIAEYAAAAGMDPGTLRVAKLVCSRIPVLCRHNTLSWSHHCEVGRAFKEPAEIEQWLNVAATEGLSVRGLRRRIRVHLASRNNFTEDAGGRTDATAPFALLRELRAAGRIIAKCPNAWTDWSPAACKTALAEIKPVIDLIEVVRARAELVDGTSPAG